MGWAIAKELRHTLFDTVNARKSELVPATHSIVDLSATMRRSVYKGASAETVAERLITKFSVVSGEHAIIFLIDDADRIPTIRLSALYAKRYKKLDDDQIAAAQAKGKIVVAGRAYAPGSQPYTENELEEIEKLGTKEPLDWQRLLASAHGKHVAYGKIKSAIAHTCQAKVRSQKFKVALLWKHKDLYIYPNSVEAWPPTVRKKMCDNNYGEADHKVIEAVHAVKDIAGPITIWTGDTDIYIQVHAADMPKNVTIAMNDELVSVDAWKKFGTGGISSAIELLLMGGADYQDGLTPFGYTMRDIATSVALKDAEEYATVKNDTLVVNHAMLKRKIASIHRRACKRRLFADFNAELNLVLYTAALFAGVAKKKAHRGGPDIPNFAFAANTFGSADAVHTYLRDASKANETFVVA